MAARSTEMANFALVGPVVDGLQVDLTKASKFARREELRLSNVRCFHRFVPSHKPDITRFPSRCRAGWILADEPALAEHEARGSGGSNFCDRVPRIARKGEKRLSFVEHEHGTDCSQALLAR